MCVNVTIFRNRTDNMLCESRQCSYIKKKKKDKQLSDIRKA